MTDKEAKEEPTKAESKAVEADNTYDPVAEDHKIREERAALEQEQLDKIGEEGVTHASTGASDVTRAGTVKPE